ncbi:hypothetical protein [Gordonia humi]|uniref:Lipoprotein n=1 Tax=Gordonia humi TaxID=686429 RepID=A0A840F3E5_9ACTN|nr:hypothetical protein [Gordonia humi]MBB4136988.1 hypothetical protein [Gordonia humi]
MGVRTAVSVVMAVIVGGTLVGCSEDSAPVHRPAGSSSQTAGSGDDQGDHSDVERAAAVQVCRQVITSAGVMVRDYNTFMKRLNDTQSYAQIGSEDEWAVETLQTGADVVRESISPSVPQDLVDTVSEFVDSSEKLAERIEQKQRTALNRSSQEWGDRRTAALDDCSAFLPTE